MWTILKTQDLKKQTIQLEKGQKKKKDINKHFTKEDILIANKYLKIWR